MKNIKNILIALSMLVSLQAIAMQPIPHPTQSTTLSGAPTEIKIIITQLLTNFKKYDDAIKAVNALYQTDKKFRSIVETTNPEWLINTLAQNYCRTKERIANNLKIKSVRALLSSPEENWLKTAIAQENAERGEMFENPNPFIQAILSDNFELVKALAPEYDLKRLGCAIGESIAINIVTGGSPITVQTDRIIQFLLENGINPNSLNALLVLAAKEATIHGATYMFQEELYNNTALDLVKLLVRYNVDANYKLAGSTALLEAVSHANNNSHVSTSQTIAYLLYQGKANPNVKNSDGKTALDLAEEKQLKYVIPVLEAYGAKHGNELP